MIQAMFQPDDDLSQQLLFNGDGMDVDRITDANLNKVIKPTNIFEFSALMMLAFSPMGICGKKTH